MGTTFAIILTGFEKMVLTKPIIPLLLGTHSNMLMTQYILRMVILIHTLN